jgi:hypothetical protein
MRCLFSEELDASPAITPVSADAPQGTAVINLESPMALILMHVAGGSRHMPLLNKDSLKTIEQIDQLCESLLMMDDLNEIKAAIKVIEHAMLAFKACGAGLVKAVNDMRKHFALSKRSADADKKKMPI